MRGYPRETTRPLYMPGLDIRLGANPSEVELTVPDPARAGDLRGRARVEVTPAGVSWR